MRGKTRQREFEEYVKCKICGEPSALFAEAVLLERHNCAYYRCEQCGFVQTVEPHWLEEAYAEPITRADVGLVTRNQRLVRITKSLITAFFDVKGRFVDYGGGYGLFVRMMRDAGYDFYRYDKHCKNILAPDFEADPEREGGYELVTAFEIFEHLADPVAEVERMLAFSGQIFFCTELMPQSAPSPGQWSYYGLDHGQHVSFFTRRSLEILAGRFGLRLYSDGKFRHLLTARKLSPLGFRLLSTYKVAALLSPFTGRGSLTAADYQKITGNKLN